MTFGSQVDLDTAGRMLDIARSNGITMIDTANVYNGGASETMLGELLGGEARDQFLLASKVGMPSPDAGEHSPLSRDAILASIEASLRRLRTDRLDVYYLHQPDRQTPIEETLATVNELVTQGVVGEIGVSNYAAWQIAELLEVSRRKGFVAPTVSQPLYSLVARRIEAEYIEFSATAGLSNIVYNPLGGGLLTGKHVFEHPEEGGRFGESGLGPMYRERYWNRQLFEAVGELTRVAEEAGLTLIQLAYRWLMSRSSVAAVLVGASDVAHLESNIEASRGPGPDDTQSDRIDEIWRGLDGPAPAYSR